MMEHLGTHIKLSNEDWELFIKTIENPPPANQALIDAIRRYKESSLNEKEVTNE